MLDLVYRFTDYPSGGGTRQFQIDIKHACDIHPITIDPTILESTDLSFEIWNDAGAYEWSLDANKVDSTPHSTGGCGQVEFALLCWSNGAWGYCVDTVYSGTKEDL